MSKVPTPTLEWYSSSTNDEDGDFSEFTSDDFFKKDKLQCYECEYGAVSVAAIGPALGDIQHLAKLGMCVSDIVLRLKCLEVKSLKVDFNNFKIAVKEEILKINCQLLRNASECKIKRHQ